MEKKSNRKKTPKKFQINEYQQGFAIFLFTAGHFFVYETQISKLISNTVFMLLSLC